MARFVDALRGNKLLSAEMTARMLTPKPELLSPNYGFGAQIFDSTANLVGHTGGGPGTAAHVQFDKTTGLTAIVLSNNAGPSAAMSAAFSRHSRSPDGKLLWRVPAPTVLPEYGTATSPVVDPGDGTSVIAHVGGYGDGALTSFDAATGKPRWQWNGDGPGYGSPIIATLGLNASTGTFLWQMPFTTDLERLHTSRFQDLLINAGIDWPSPPSG